VLNLRAFVDVVAGLAGRAARVGLLLGAAASTGCTFRPHIPDQAVTCSADPDCPEGFTCNVPLARCCRPGACDEAPASNTDPARPGKSPPIGANDAGASGSAEAGPGRPIDDAGSAEAPASAAADGAARAEDAVPMACSGTTPVPPAEPGRQTFCTVVAQDTEVSLSIHSMVPGDAISARTYGLCTAPLPLGRETSGSGSVGGALSDATLAALIAVTGQYQRLCDQHQARLVGAAAGAWARQASNRADIEAKFRTATGLGLDIGTPAEEFAEMYLGLTRNQRGRVVLLTSGDRPEIVVWGKGAPLLTRQPLPLSFTDAGTMYFADAYNRFDNARRSLRARLSRDLEPQIDSLRLAVLNRAVEPGFVIGPAAATVPLALSGQLRDPRGTWNSITEFQKKRDDAAVTPSPYGRIFGAAPIMPPQIDAFLASLDDSQWRQLGADPVREAYGAELFYLTTLLDVLASQARASEFAFVFANPHLGYLFAKLLPPPI
jgi:hypothetical protein